MKTTGGFTLIELLVSISIISVLAVIGITIFSNVQNEAKNSRRKADVVAIAKAMESNYDPVSGTYITTKILDGTAFASGSRPIPPEGGEYLGDLVASSKGFRVCTSLISNLPNSCSVPVPDQCFCIDSEQGIYDEISYATPFMGSANPPPTPTSGPTTTPTPTTPPPTPTPTSPPPTPTPGPSFATDDFDFAPVVLSLPFNSPTTAVSFYTTAADDPLYSCAGNVQRARTAWYKYTPSVNQTITVDTIGSNYDTVLAIRTGTRGALTTVACNDDLGGGPLQSRVSSIAVTGGTTYYIEVAQYSVIGTPNLIVNITSP